MGCHFTTFRPKVKELFSKTGPPLTDRRAASVPPSDTWTYRWAGQNEWWWEGFGSMTLPRGARRRRRSARRSRGEGRLAHHLAPVRSPQPTTDRRARVGPG